MIALSEPQIDDLMQRPLSPSRSCSTFKTSALGFALWWFMLLALHIVNLAYYVGVAMLYTENRATNLEFQLDTYSIGISFREWGRVSVVHIIVAVVHAGCILSMLIGSLAAGRPAFQPRSSRLLRMYRKRFARKVATDTQHTQPRQDSPLLVVANAVVRSVSGIFGREGLLGVDGVYFDHLHLTHELLETALQTIQCYRMSYLLPRVWLIRFYAALLVANCWSTPIVHRYYGDRHVERRMMSLLCDAVLDVVSSIGVSFWIFATYAPQYTDPVFGFPFDYWFDDVWFANMQQEFQMMLIVSWADMASRLVFALGLLQCMDAMKDLLTPALAEEGVESNATGEASRQPLSRVWAQRQTGHVQGETHKQVRPVGVVSSPPTAEDDALNKCCRSPLVPSRPVHFVLYVAGPGIFIVWGLLIVCLHSVAEAQYHASYGHTCNLRLQPWFVSKPACSLVEIDCHALGNLSGTLDSLRDAWNIFQPGTTARLVLRHCAQLEIPPTISRFTILSGLKIYNSTINSWPADAALAEPAHTSMRVVFLIRCRLREGVLPPGLVSDQFPRGFKSVIVMDTDLASLPTNLHELWPQGMTLTLERTMITTIPECIMHLRPMVLSFAGSPIETVPASLFEIPTVECVLLSYTKVQALPRSVATPSSRWYLLLLQGTNVSTFWSWMDPFIEYSMWYQSDFFNAYETPFCYALQEIATGTITAFPSHPSESTALASVMDVSTPERLARSQQAVTCTPGFPFYFPLDLEDMAHAITD
jgi:hypothetical protein